MKCEERVHPKYGNTEGTLFSLSFYFDQDRSNTESIVLHENGIVIDNHLKSLLQ